jgi:hypothetical protein
MVEEPEVASILDDPHVQALLKGNQEDLRIYTAALSIRASSNFVPVIRLPTAVNNVYGELIQLVEYGENEGPTPRRREETEQNSQTIFRKTGRRVT